jgi:predicted MFS family arabinose efflux permease
LLTHKIGILKGWQTLFILEAIPALLFGILILFWIKDWPKDASWLTTSEQDRLTNAYHKELSIKKAQKHYTVWQALSDREVLKLCLIYFLWITGFWGYNFWMPKVLKDNLGWSPLRIGWMVVIPMSLALIGMVLVGHSSGRTGEKRWHGAIPMFIAAVGMGLGPFLHDPISSFSAVCLAGIGVYSAFGVWWSYPTTFLSGTAAASAVGLINSCGNIGGFLGPYLTGWVKEHTGSYQNAYLYLAASLFASGLLMLSLKKSPSLR